MKGSHAIAAAPTPKNCRRPRDKYKGKKSKFHKSGNFLKGQRTKNLQSALSAVRNIKRAAIRPICTTILKDSTLARKFIWQISAYQLLQIPTTSHRSFLLQKSGLV